MFWMPDQVRHDVFGTFYEGVSFDGLVKSPHSVILRSGATKNLNDIRFFAIAQNDKGVFFQLFTNASALIHLQKKVHQIGALFHGSNTSPNNSMDVKHLLTTTHTQNTPAIRIFVFENLQLDGTAKNHLPPSMLIER